MSVKITPDWERRYEVAKDLLCASVISGGSCTKEDIQFAISTANDFVEEMNRWKLNSSTIQHTE